MVSKKRILDPQQWNMYGYARNSPVIYLDPDGREVTLYLLNTAGYSDKQATSIAQHTGQTLHNAGLNNVHVIVTRDSSLSKLENKHTVVGELVRGDKGKLGSAGGDQGKHAVFSHEFVVNVNKANPDPGDQGRPGGALFRSAETKETTAVANVTSHEFTHETNSAGNLGRLVTDGAHGEGLFASPMPLDVNYDPNAKIPEPQAGELREQFNRPNEKDEGVKVEVRPEKKDPR